MNALRHGLAINMQRDLRHFSQIWNLAQHFADDLHDPAVATHALLLAEACFDLHRIEELKALIVNRILNDPQPRPLTFGDAYDCLVFAEKWAAGAVRNQVAAAKEKAGCATQEDRRRADMVGSWNFYMAGQWRRMQRRILGNEGGYLEQAANELAKLNRYHQRALAKKQKAVRGLGRRRLRQLAVDSGSKRDEAPGVSSPVTSMSPRRMTFPPAGCCAQRPRAMSNETLKSAERTQFLQRDQGSGPHHSKFGAVH